MSVRGREFATEFVLRDWHLVQASQGACACYSGLGRGPKPPVRFHFQGPARPAPPPGTALLLSAVVPAAPNRHKYLN